LIRTPVEVGVESIRSSQAAASRIDDLQSLGRNVDDERCGSSSGADPVVPRPDRKTFGRRSGSQGSAFGEMLAIAFPQEVRT